MSQVMIPAEAVSRSLTIKAVVDILNGYANKINKSKATAETVFNVLGEDNVKVILEALPLRVLTALEDDEVNITTIINELPNESLLTLHTLVQDVPDELIEKLANDYKLNVEAVKKNQTDRKTRAVRLSKMVVRKDITFDINKVNEMLAVCNDIINEVITDIGNVPYLNPLHAMNESYNSDGAVMCGQISVCLAAINTLFDNNTIADDLKIKLDLITVNLEQVKGLLIGVDGNARDLIQSLSGILMATLPNVKPRSKAIHATLVDTDDGITVTFPKPMVVKYGVAYAISLGCLIPETTVKFESEIFKALAIRTDRTLGTVMLLTSTTTDTIKLGEGAELGIIIRK